MMIMIINHGPLSMTRSLVMACSIVTLLSACQEKERVCKAPSHWLSKNEPNPDLTPKSLVTVNAAGDVRLNNRATSMEALRATLDRVSRFDRSELIEVRMSNRLPCDKAEVVIDLIDKSAKCKQSTYCRVGFSD